VEGKESKRTGVALASVPIDPPSVYCHVGFEKFPVFMF